MLRILKLELKKAFLSYKFWITLAVVPIIMYLNLLDEMNISSGTDICSVLYLWVYRHMLGGISILLLFVCALPAALQFNVERNSGAIKDYIIYEGKMKYLFAKVFTTWFVTFIAFLLGYVIVFLFLVMRFPLYPSETDLVNQLLYDFPYKTMLNESPMIFFIVIPEVGLYAFMSVISLLVSLHSSNTYVILVSPVIFYYIWNYLCGSLQLPNWLCWTLKRDYGFTFPDTFPSYIAYNLFYFLIASMVVGIAFLRRGRQEVENV